MAEKYLIDTSAVIKYLNQTFLSAGITFIDNIVDEESIISFITEIELQVWVPLNDDDLLIYKSFVNSSTKIDIDADIKEQAIRIRRNNKLKLPDAIIAATAIVRNYILVADNDPDFTRIPDLKYINPGRL
jgi:predicted nucleic acid-binding protein